MTAFRTRQDSYASEFRLAMLSTIENALADPKLAGFGLSDESTPQGTNEES
jgi:hypothetical protein